MSQTRQNPSCYMCDAPSTSKDHVPPLCLFPESPEFRKSLVKVWSCDKHNSGKSMDDVWLRWVLATGGGNEIAVKILNEAAGPHLEKNPHLRKTFQPDAHFAVRDGQIERATWAIDSARFINAITTIVRGLFYHHGYYQMKLTCDMEVRWAFLKDREAAIASMNLSKTEYEVFTQPSTYRPHLHLGANPKVFQYAFDQYSDPEHEFCALRFYEGDTINVQWKILPLVEWTTSLKGISEYFGSFSQMKLPPQESLDEKEKIDLLGQCELREVRLAELARIARHKQDLAAYSMVKMLRRENYRNKQRIVGGTSETPK